MDFASLVLMERDKKTNIFVRELGSYEVNEGAEYITKMFYDGEDVVVYFDTKRDVEEWEYSAIFDLFSTSEFSINGFNIEDIDDEFNPTWLVKFKYIEEHNVMADKLNKLCAIIEENLKKVFEDIIGKEEDY